MKARHTIAVEDVCRVFDDARIERLVRVARLPIGTDVKRLADGIRDAARIYARDASEPTVNELRAEIEQLHRAAARGKYDQLAKLLEALSPKARRLLGARGKRLGVSLPPAKALQTAEAERASAIAVKITSVGGQYVQGRKRLGEKRSRPAWQPLIYAPDARQHFPKREAERNLIINLQIGWFEAVQEQPSVSVNRQRPSPFAKMAAECFKLVGAAHADVFGLINSVNRRRRIKKLSAIKTRTG